MKNVLIIHFGILRFVDIDECASGTHNCHSSLASCTNTVGSFSCSCNHPYNGNGRTCNLASGNQLAEYYEDTHLLDLWYAGVGIVVTFGGTVLILISYLRH